MLNPLEGARATGFSTFQTNITCWEPSVQTQNFWGDMVDPTLTNIVDNTKQPSEFSLMMHRNNTHKKTSNDVIGSLWCGLCEMIINT